MNGHDLTQLWERARLNACPRPYITCDPAISWGAPCLEHTRLRVETVVGYLLAGESVESVMSDYDLSRWAVLTACWWHTEYEDASHSWCVWAERWFQHIAGYDGCPISEVPDPPAVKR